MSLELNVNEGSNQEEFHDSTLPDLKFENQGQFLEEFIPNENYLKSLFSPFKDGWKLNKNHVFFKSVRFLVNEKYELSSLSIENKKAILAIYLLVKFHGHDGIDRINEEHNQPYITLGNKSFLPYTLDLFVNNNIYYKLRGNQKMEIILMSKTLSRFFGYMENRYEVLKKIEYSKYYRKESLVECILDNELEESDSKEIKKFVLNSSVSQIKKKEKYILSFLTKNQPKEKNKDSSLKYNILIEKWLKDITGHEFKLVIEQGRMGISKIVDLIALTSFEFSGLILPPKILPDSSTINIVRYSQEKKLELIETILKYEKILKTKTSEENNSAIIRDKKMGEQIVNNARRMNEFGISNFELTELWKNHNPTNPKKL